MPFILTADTTVTATDAAITTLAKEIKTLRSNAAIFARKKAVYRTTIPKKSKTNLRPSLKHEMLLDSILKVLNSRSNLTANFANTSLLTKDLTVKTMSRSMKPSELL